jgi:F-type H+-transporting ATPase subunit b
MNIVRKRQLLAGLALVIVGLFAVGGTAFAQDTNPSGESGGETTHEFADHASEECANILNEGGTVDDCQESPNPILPATNEIIWGSLAFAILFLAFLKWGLPAVRNMMAVREDRIRGDLERAEAARNESEQVLEQYRAQLADARTEASRILEEARQAADQMRRDLIARAEADAAELRGRAQEDIRLAGERAMADLRTRVADLSIELAERIVERNLDRDTQLALIENYINEVGTNR